MWGPPGVGKFSIVKQIAAESGWGFLDLRLLLLNPIDLRGIPYPNRETRQADWLAPSFLPHVERDGAAGIILYDEITAAPRAVQAAAYQLILDRRVGEYTLPEGWRQVAAGNRAQDKGVTNQMPAALANRMIHFEVTCSLEDWKHWAIPNMIDHRVISFLNFRPELLYRFPNQAAEQGLPHPAAGSSCTNPPFLRPGGQGFPGYLRGGRRRPRHRIYRLLPDVGADTRRGRNPGRQDHHSAGFPRYDLRLHRGSGQQPGQ